MKKLLFTTIACLFLASGFAQWKAAGDKIKTVWAEQVDINHVLGEYPRPILVRTDWQNLNGLWDYAVRPIGAACPAQFDGKILVPFAIESALSGVQQGVNENQELWYSRIFNVPSKWKTRKILLHFGAVDWKTDVWVNGIQIGRHTGGYTGFTLDITAALVAKNNRLVVRVWDPTSKGEQPRGKQQFNPEGIFYTPVTGIWQTVWLEPVSDHYIRNLKITSDVDRKIIAVDAQPCVAGLQDVIEVLLSDDGKEIAKAEMVSGQPVELRVEEPKLWSPESPFLYDLKITLKSGGKVVDVVRSYAAMRKFSIKKNADGIVRMQLNNKDYFQFGPLDQGWWPDGLYTAPTDEALKFDIAKTKDFGFNMIRKHVKVEPERWYSYCDRLGIIVWQDMPSGGFGPEWQPLQFFNGSDAKRSKESEANYRKELKEMMDQLYSHPCIGVWTTFNESWGQFKTPEIVDWVKQYDPSRLVNAASGGNHYVACGDLLDLHSYPAPKLYLMDGVRPVVLGEYGGIGLPVAGHLWNPEKSWGYVKFGTSEDATDEYVKYAQQLYDLIPHGFSAGVYTQTTDVEGEINGLMTYDRKVIKMNASRLREINQKICTSLHKF